MEKCPYEPICGAMVVRSLRKEKDFLKKFCYGKNQEWRKCVHFKSRDKEKERVK